MYRLVPRSPRPATYPGVSRLPVASAFRKLATIPPASPQGQSGTGQTSPARPEGSNTLVILSALGALGGLYYYYTRGQPAIDREAARRKEEEMEKSVKETGEAGKSKMKSVGRQSQQEYNEAKATVQDAATAAHTRSTEAITDLAERARQGAHEGQAKLDGLKSTAERKMNDARERSEKRLEEGRVEVARQASDAENKTRGWFGWGGSK